MKNFKVVDLREGLREVSVTEVTWESLRKPQTTGGSGMTRQFKTTTDLDRWYRVETLNLITQLETRRITENNYIYCMMQLGKKWDSYYKRLHGLV